MISKQSFVAILRAIREQEELDGKNGDLLTQLADPEFVEHKTIFTTPLISKLLNILKDEFELEDDKYIGNDISYFIYDLQWGTNEMAKDCITRKDGSKVSLQTLEELYDWITGEAK